MSGNTFLRHLFRNSKSLGEYPMEYDIKYENGKVVFIAKHKNEILVLLAKYFRSETLGI